MFNNYFSNLPLITLIVTITDGICCHSFLHFGYKKTGQNQMKLVEKQNILYFDSRNILICIDLTVDCNYYGIFVLHY